MAHLISAIAVLIAALSFAYGVYAWKREFVGKRRIELAESALAMFYEAEDAIRDIRNPMSSGGEGRTRTRGDNESAEASQLLDRAYIVFERYHKREQLFAQLRSAKYRVMASFGPTRGAPFEELTQVLNDIFISAHLLGSHYWPRQGRVPMTDEEFQRHLVEMHRYEAVFSRLSQDQDEISARVHSAVLAMEATTASAVRSQQSRWERVRKWATHRGAGS